MIWDIHQNIAKVTLVGYQQVLVISGIYYFRHSLALAPVSRSLTLRHGWPAATEYGIGFFKMKCITVG